MNELKIIALKFLILAGIIVCFNLIYKYFFYENDVQEYSDIINLVRHVVKEKAEVVYVGESSNISYRDDDIDKRSISDFISDYYPFKNFGTITKPASHAGIFYELLKNIPENSSIKTVIVTLNLRSFNSNWIYSNLETPLQKSMVLLKGQPPLYARFLLSFRGYDIKTDSEREKQVKDKWKKDIIFFPEPFIYNNVIDWDIGMAQQGILNTDGSFNAALTELACHYIKTYAFQIDTLTNPRIKDFDRIVTLAHDRHWNLVFNLLAENVERANNLVGKELVYLIKQNRDLLIKRYNRNKVIVVDNLELIGNRDYTDKYWTTEHYTENGRRKIARNIAEGLKGLYLKDFVNVTYEIKKQTEFFNDCEGDIPWGELGTLTSEKSFSGVKSSKSGQNQDYSIAFEYPIDYLPDSIKQISIEMQIFQDDINHDAALVIEISGKLLQNQWNGFLISDISKTIKNWTKISYQFPLSESFYNGDLIKIFVHNPSQSLIYIDDFKILFTK
jgi:hypothetical protein